MHRRAFIEYAGLAGGLAVTQEVLSIGRLVLPFNPKSKKSSVLESPFVYDPDAGSNMLVCFGDSNMTGGVGGEVVSPANWVADLVGSRGIGRWDIKVYAEVGATTARVRDSQLREAEIDEGLNGKKFDIWLNVGGNDMLSLASNKEKAQELAEMMRNPRRNIWKSYSFVRDVDDRVEQFGQDFSQLLLRIKQLFNNRVDNVVVNTLPDLSVVSTINTGIVDGKVYEFALTNPLVRSLIHNVSRDMNNKMIEALEIFAKASKSPSFLAIDTFDFPANHFQGDEHFGDRGKNLLAQRFVDRIHNI